MFVSLQGLVEAPCNIFPHVCVADQRDKLKVYQVNRIEVWLTSTPHQKSKQTPNPSFTPMLILAFEDSEAEPVQLRVLMHWWRGKVGGTVNRKEPNSGGGIIVPTMICQLYWSILFPFVLWKGSEVLWSLLQEGLEFDSECVFVCVGYRLIYSFPPTNQTNAHQLVWRGWMVDWRIQVYL